MKSAFIIAGGEGFILFYHAKLPYLEKNKNKNTTFLSNPFVYNILLCFSFLLLPFSRLWEQSWREIFFSRSLIHGSSAAFGKFWGTEQHMGFITAPEHFDGLLRNAGYFTPAHFLFAVYAAVAVTNRLSFQPHTKLHVLGQPRALANFQAKPYNPFWDNRFSPCFVDETKALIPYLTQHKHPVL